MVSPTEPATPYEILSDEEVVARVDRPISPSSRLV